VTIKRKGARPVVVIREKYSDGTELTLSGADALIAGARQLRAFAAAEPDHPQRAELLIKAALYEQEARTLASRQAVADHEHRRRQRGGKTVGGKRSATWADNKDKLRGDAAKRWKKHPTYTIENMATILVSKKSATYTSVRTVANLIRDLKPAKKSGPKK
jgi:hypothetical protein